MVRLLASVVLLAALGATACYAEVVDGLLVVRGQVTLPDGSPAASAMVAAAGSPPEPRRVTTTDSQGRYELRGVFGNGLRLHAASADRQDQSVRLIPSTDARFAAQGSVDLRLSPAVKQRVQIAADDADLAGVLVLAAGLGFEVHGRTDASGAVELDVPAEPAVDKIVAWGAAAGVGGVRAVDGDPIDHAARITLLPPAEHTVRVVDDQGAPVPGLEIATSFRTEASSWILTKHLPETNLRSDAQGKVRIPWAPRDGLKYVECDPVGGDWMLYEVDQPSTTGGDTVVHLRRRNLGRPAVGHVALPNNASPEGLMIAGTSTGAGSHFDAFYSRVEADGSFAYHVPIGMATGVAVADREWASDFWTGVVVPWEDAAPESADLAAYPATRAVVKVTSGGGYQPLANAWIHFRREARFPYLKDGSLQETFTVARAWFLTDQAGMAEVPCGDGANELRVSAGNWSSEREILVNATDRPGPIEAKFHRPAASQNR